MDPQPTPTCHSGAELAPVKTGGRNPEAAQGKPSLSKPSPHFADHFTFFTETAMKKTRNSYDPSEVPLQSFLSVRPERREVVCTYSRQLGCTNYSPEVEGLPPTPNGRKWMKMGGNGRDFPFFPQSISPVPNTSKESSP